ncbi:MAG: DUF4080 domain-containing protein, partial [Oligosphaeraceae bacterium]|nr:DUF4080 domain-containing protein [Oligosphaeraceae bacterium]
SLALPLLHLASRDVPGWEWQKLETLSTDDPGETAVRLAEMQPDLVCASLYLFNRRQVTDILDRLHALCPDCHILVGGPECLRTQAGEIVRSCEAIDGAVSGEGESVLPELLRRLAAGNFPEPVTLPIPGVTVRCRNQQNVVLCCGKHAPRYRHWADAPAPPESEFFAVDKPFVQMETSRGCRQGCRYCTSFATPVRYKQLTRIAEELQLLAGKGVQEIRLLDRTFNAPPERAAELLRLFKDKFPNLRFHLEIHPQFLSDELKWELQHALPGQLHLEVGIQSLDDTVQKAIGRACPVQDALAGLQFLCACPAFEVHADLLAGLPRQSSASLWQDVRQLLAIGPAEIQLEVLKILPGTPFRSQAAKLGLIYSPQPPYEVLGTADFPPQELLHARLLSRMLDLFYNHPALQDAFRRASRNNPEFPGAFLQYLQPRGFALNWSGSLRKRLQLLADFLGGSSPEASSALAFQWLKAGLPPNLAPCYPAQTAAALPEALTLLEGSEACRRGKIWHLQTARGSYYFVFDRSVCLNLPAAIWRDDPSL